MKGEREAVGNPGRKGDKGEKGESAKASQSTVVPQTNWKQCVWKSVSGTDNGKIKVIRIKIIQVTLHTVARLTTICFICLILFQDCSFNKLQSNSALRVLFQGNMGVYGSGAKCNRWYFKFNGNESSGPMTIDAVVCNNWPSGNPNLLHHRSFEGYCENIPQGAVRVELWIGRRSGKALSNAATGWNSVSRIMIEEVSWSQS